MIKQNFDITNLSNFHTPAKAKFFYEFNWDTQELIEVLKNFKNEKKLFISWWTNLLFAFNNFNWLVVKLKNYPIKSNIIVDNLNSFFNKKIKTQFNIKNGVLEVSWFEKISDVSESLYKLNLSKTWERFIGLPGSIAWAIVGNAGCFWLEIQHTFIKALVLDLNDFQLKEIDKQKAEFSYRNSIFKKWKFIVLKWWFNLNSKEEKYPFTKTIDDIIDFRLNKQPQWFSCWSFFKNPSKEHPAGKLIEAVWLKWYKLWWAFFSEKHANFLMSDWTATWQDLINLKNLAQKKVYENFSIKLEPEVNIITN